VQPRSWERVRVIDLADEVAGAEVAEEDAVHTLEESARRQEGFLSMMRSNSFLDPTHRGKNR